MSASNQNGIKQNDFFDEFGLQLAPGNIERGSTYPLYGMITKIVDETPGSVAIEINRSIILQLAVRDEKGIETLKERIFESGIFVSKILETEPVVIAQCETVIFGKRQALAA
jgi:hypothetical protein